MTEDQFCSQQCLPDFSLSKKFREETESINYCLQELRTFKREKILSNSVWSIFAENNTLSNCAAVTLHSSIHRSMNIRLVAMYDKASEAKAWNCSNCGVQSKQKTRPKPLSLDAIAEIAKEVLARVKDRDHVVSQAFLNGKDEPGGCVYNISDITRISLFRRVLRGWEQANDPDAVMGAKVRQAKKLVKKTRNNRIAHMKIKTRSKVTENNYGMHDLERHATKMLEDFWKAYSGETIDWRDQSFEDSQKIFGLKSAA